MINRSDFGDVTAFRATWSRSRLSGYSVNFFLVRGVLVDSAFPAIARDVRALIDLVRPRGAFITHHHEDHAGNVQLLAEHGVPIAMDAVTAARVRDPGRIGLYRHFTWKAMRPLTSVTTPFEDNAISLIPTPGHCANHQAVWDASTDTLFAGDLFLGVKVRIANASENPRAQVQSLRAMIARKPSRVFCAHRGLLADGVSMLTAKADWMEQMIHDVEQRIDAGQNDNQIRRELIGPLGNTHFVSAGDYSPVNLVTAIRRTRPNDSDPAELPKR